MQGTTLEDVFHQQLGYPLWSATPVDKDPEAIISAHLAFLRAGADVIITSTYQAAFYTYEIAGYSREDAKRLMLEAVKLAIEAKRRYIQETAQCDRNDAGSSRSVKIALSLGPYGSMLSPAQEFHGFYPPPFGPTLPSETAKTNIFDDTEDGQHLEAAAVEALEDFHYERLEVFAENREVWDEIDLVAFETVPLRREIAGVRRAVARLQRIKELKPAGQPGEHSAKTMKPWWISTVHPDGHYPEMKPGGGWVTMVEVAEAALLGEDERTSIPWGLGINCTGLEFLPKLVGEARDVARQALEVHGVGPWLVLYPNGGDVFNPETHSWEAKGRGETRWGKEMCTVVAESRGDEVWGGVVVGGCCKTGPDDISELRDELHGCLDM
ncbi:Homocysteine S-methyltransferase [Ganoderma leucocontextum]|nr:Homocysteine S-methyltransferase [Ganoderma leucocontextum]